ncbi:MAG: L-rhamnose isomerase, partial [Armatimonadetes bacterium]|nr:L-rhamnose isomerase [Armatimonadota bacterium]
DKISAILQFADELLVHVSRGVRWDSDHVPILDDQVRSLMQEIVRSDALDRVHLATDFFDASMNRIGAWVIGARAVLQGALLALLEPREKLRQIEEKGKNFARLAVLEEMKAMPFGAVWDYHCLRGGVPAASAWIEDVEKYEAEVTAQRGSAGAYWKQLHRASQERPYRGRRGFCSSRRPRGAGWRGMSSRCSRVSTRTAIR